MVGGSGGLGGVLGQEAGHRVPFGGARARDDLGRSERILLEDPVQRVFVGGLEDQQGTGSIAVRPAGQECAFTGKGSGPFPVCRAGGVPCFGGLSGVYVLNSKNSHTDTLSPCPPEYVSGSAQEEDLGEGGDSGGPQHG